MSEISMNLQEQIAFCEEKSKNIKLKTEPLTFVNIKSNLEKLEKIEQAIPDIEHLEELMIKMFEEWDCFKEHSYFEKLGIAIFSEGMQTVSYILDCLKD